MTAVVSPEPLQQVGLSSRWPFEVNGDKHPTWSTAEPILNGIEYEGWMQLPRTIPTRLEGMPSALKSYPQWVCWRLTRAAGTKPDSTGKLWTKIPVNPHTGQRGSCSDPETWGSYAEAEAYYCKHRHDDDAYTVAHGVGFVFTAEDPFTFIDGDGWVIGGELTPTAKTVIATLDSFTELSLSGNGIHHIVIGDKPPGKCRLSDQGLEVYNQNRFVALTGQVLFGRQEVRPQQAGLNSLFDERFPELSEGHNSTLFTQRLRGAGEQPWDTGKARGSTATGADKQDAWRVSVDTALESMLKKPQAAKLFAGDCSDYPREDGTPDQSRGEAALMMHAANATNGNPQQMDAIMRRSKLNRDKWDRLAHGGRTYGQNTIGNVLLKWNPYHRYKPTGRKRGRPHSGTLMRAVELMQNEPAMRPAALANNLGVSLDYGKKLRKRAVILITAHGDAANALASVRTALRSAPAFQACSDLPAPVPDNPSGAPAVALPCSLDHCVNSEDICPPELVTFEDYRALVTGHADRFGLNRPSKKTTLNGYTLVTYVATELRMSLDIEDMAVIFGWLAKEYELAVRRPGTMDKFRRTYSMRLTARAIMRLQSKAGDYRLDSFVQTVRGYLKHVGAKFYPHFYSLVREYLGLCRAARNKGIADALAATRQHLYTVRDVNMPPRKLATIAAQVRQSMDRAAHGAVAAAATTAA